MTHVLGADQTDYRQQTASTTLVSKEAKQIIALNFPEIKGKTASWCWIIKTSFEDEV
jgi:hypothetical protein